jgi:hypothetical protein
MKYLVMIHPHSSSLRRQAGIPRGREVRCVVTVLSCVSPRDDYLYTVRYNALL